MAREAVKNGADCDNPIKRLFHPNLSLAHIRSQPKTAVFTSTEDSLTRPSEALVVQGLQVRSAPLKAIAKSPIGTPGRKGSIKLPVARSSIKAIARGAPGRNRSIKSPVARSSIEAIARGTPGRNRSIESPVASAQNHRSQRRQLKRYNGADTYAD
jgi:hypothetical protein